MEKAKCEIWKEYKKYTHFSSGAGWIKGSYFVGWQMLRFLGPEFIPNHKNVFKERKMQFLLINGWFVRYLAGLWVLWLVFGWFVGGMAGL